MTLRHLATRFFGSLDKRPLSHVDVEWVRTQLLPAEFTLWCRYSFPDRRHTIAVARDVERQLGPGADRPVLAAALLHDIGKIDSNLGTYGRVAATVLGAVLPPAATGLLAQRRGVLGNVAAYLQHDDRGGELLRQAGSHDVTVRWATEHELPRDQWTLPPDITAALYAADNR